MRQIDRLIVRARKIKPLYEDIYIINNVAGRWVLDGKDFGTQQEAIRYVDRISEGYDDVLVIINDAGPAVERSVLECGKNQIEVKHSPGSTPDTHKGYEYGGKRGNRRKNSKYHHSWV